MSEMERNKGKLIPATDHLTIESFDGDNDEWADYLYNNDLMYIHGVVYRVEYEIESGDCYGFADVTKNDDGTIDFHTMHYNGGGSLEEVLEDALE